MAVKGCSLASGILAYEMSASAIICFSRTFRSALQGIVEHLV